MADVAELRADLFRRIDAIAPTLAADIEAGDELRRLPDASAAALRSAGLLGLKVPAVLGGTEAEPGLQFDVFERVAHTSISAAWCLFIWADSVGAACARLSDDGVARLLGAGGDVPYMAGGGGLRPGALIAAPGGYRLTGTFRYGSGIHAAQWVLLTGFVNEGNVREPRVCVVARDDVAVEDNWHVLGMRATGSVDFTVTDAFVPAELTYPALAPPARGGRMYRTGTAGYLAYPLPAVTLGLARRVLEELMASASSVTRGYFRPAALADRATFHRFLGQADQRLRAARALMLASGEQLMAAAEQDSPAALRAVEADARAAGAHAVAVARDVLSETVHWAGGSALRQGSLYERATRDMAVASSHFLADESAFENHAQFLLGIPGADPLA